jgi:hypothetical protein
MPNYSLNTGLPEKPRPLDDLGYNPILNTTSPPAGRTFAPGQKPHPLDNEVDGSTHTTILAWPEAAGDITKRTRNG